MVSLRTLLNALLGAVVAVVVSFVPGSTILGGAVAGFLESTDAYEGAIVGAIAGALTLVPLAGVAFVGLWILGFGVGLGAVPVGGLLAGILVVTLAGMFLIAYTVGLGALGGLLGSYVAGEYPDRHAQTRATLGYGEESPDRS